MGEYFYIINWLAIILGSLSLVFILGLFTFLCFQRFMWWKHKDFMTYRYMKKLSKKDSEEFWEYIDFLKKERKENNE